MCIVSRSAERIEIALEGIKKNFPKVKTKAVIADFTKMTNIEQYQTQIADALKDLDIAMLFLNAGLAFFSVKFDELEPKRIEDLFLCNTAHPLFLSRVMLPVLLKRK